MKRQISESVASGDLGARYKLAMLFKPGAPDDLRALAELGQPMAQFELGKRYELGSGIPPDRAEAKRWYGKAAEHGNVFAIDRLRLGALPDPPELSTRPKSD